MPTLKDAKARKPLPPNLLIEEMLKRKTLEQLLEDKDIYTPEAAAPLMGYHKNYVHQLCREKRIERIKRGRVYFLYARTVYGAFSHESASAAQSKRG